ncbi:MAG: hypothetical protein AAF702_50170 [Chloroflexota bacterium]
MNNHLSFYTAQSATSTPAQYIDLYSDLPTDIQGITHVIHGLMIHDHATALHNLQPTKE